MREFILKASKAFTRPFNLNDLAGSGRIDLVCRCISNAFFISEAIRKDVRFHAVLEGPPKPPKLISFFGENLKRITPDERNIGAWINKAVNLGLDLEKNEERIVGDGIKVSKKSFEELVKEKAKETQLIYLNPKGIDIREFEFEKNVCFVLGDHKGLPKNTERLLDRIGAKRISVGKLTYLASHVIVICHNELDRKCL
ncbi:MAG: tRNA (pseudouridine(54)-N(1))-methyltransferase TrmY [Candidatus Aenigmatarchaeota archaeon]